MIMVGEALLPLPPLRARHCCKKHTADRVLIAMRGSLAPLKVYEQTVALIQSRSLELHYQNF